MSDNKHTPELWKYEVPDGWGNHEITSEDGYLIATVETKSSAFAPDDNIGQGNARRIVASVNACKRFSVEILESAAACGGMVSDPVEELLATRKQRDDLLLELESVVAGCSIKNNDEMPMILHDARKVIAGVKGSAA